MENILIIVVGTMIIIMGYLVGIRKKINLVHSYHYKRVKEAEKSIFCKYIGLGNVIVGLGLMFFPILKMEFSYTVAIGTTMILVISGLITTIITIVKYNKGLF